MDFKKLYKNVLSFLFEVPLKCGFLKGLKLIKLLKVKMLILESKKSVS